MDKRTWDTWATTAASVCFSLKTFLQLPCAQELSQLWLTELAPLVIYIVFLV